MDGDATWREKHAELHGEIQTTLHHIDKNMDELAVLIEKNANKRDRAIDDLYIRINEIILFRTRCREELIKELTSLKTTLMGEATDTARREARKWSLYVVIFSTVLGALAGIIVTVLTRGT
jgi:hypothetical protein